MNEGYFSVEQRKTLERLEKDVYHGNGKPGLTTRMALMEDRADGFDETIDAFKRNFSKAVWVLIGGFGSILAAVIVDIILRLKF